MEGGASVTDLLHRLPQDPAVVQQIMPLVYAELSRLAHRQRAGWGPSATLETTDLVHEAFLKLVGSSDRAFSSRTHFFGVAAKAMRSILVDRARARRAAKRGAGAARLDIDAALDAFAERGIDVVALDDALDRLTELDQRKARLIELRFFVGMSSDDAAAALGVSVPTVERDWRLARAWLKRELGDQTTLS
jgi:RNA polymerase sigma factor (TIGR02999 family)